MEQKKEMMKKPDIKLESVMNTLKRENETLLATQMLQNEQEKTKGNLIQKGIVFYSDGSTVKLAESFINGEHLQLCMRCLKNEGNQLVYVIFEKINEVEYGLERKEQCITDNIISDMRVTIDNIINSFTGIYTNIASIKLAIKMIHQNRLLRGIRSINNDIIPLSIILEKLKEWILLNATDARIGIMKLKDVQRVVIICPKGYKDGKQVGGIFKQIFYEIAPNNNYGAFKAELIRRNMLICDRNETCLDIQKTISKSKCIELGTEHVKIICFNFEEEFVEQVIIAKSNDDDILGISDAEIEEMFNDGDKIALEYNAYEEDE